ncbi:MAG: HAD-IIIA family hydrolase [Cyclobacteriaceae bacterium]
MNKCIFLDRDGVINKERGEYTFKVEDFEILPGVLKGIKALKEHGYLIIVITNQAGISKGTYSRRDMQSCHEFFLNEAGPGMVDDIYYCPYHPTITESIARKPDTLMFERAIAKYEIDPGKSWMLGDRERDLIPAKGLSMKTILHDKSISSDYADHYVLDFASAVELILKEN